ncbi:hypothetical protein, partial [Rhizobium fabae]|uniref:hypothetical protein n=1 Tax=Rhizobium fabae TaxID=573179 RepID=UPI001ABF571C
VKQRFLHHCPLAHHRTVLPMPGTTESELHTDSNTDFFNGIGQELSFPIPACAGSGRLNS